jgi:nitroimidazol reductase NimA-like FMN-containing flavoprotein (pyridoxamine 5'-phosphate oxidase superfamily)
MSTTATEPIAELDERFSAPDATARPWSEVLSVIDAAQIFWLSTVRGDGRPHVTPIPAVWHAGALHFCSGPGEQKTTNLRANDACTLTTGTNAMTSGLDVVVEGHAARVTDGEQLGVLAAMWKDQLDWDFEVVDDGFREKTPETDRGEVEPGVAHVYAVAPDKVLAFGKGDPFSQTRYRFG